MTEDEIKQTHGRFVELKRGLNEVMINNYHPKLLQLLRCNMFIQAVTGTRAIAYYVAKYMSKAEPTHIREEIRNIITNFKTNNRSSYYKKAQQIANILIKNREICSQEATYRLLHLRLRYSSRGFVFIPAYRPQNRLRLIHRTTLFDQDPKVGLNVIDRYFNRPDELADICLIEFAAWYVPKANRARENVDNDLQDGEVVLDDENILMANSFTLKNNKGKICKRRRHAIVNYPRFKPVTETDDYLYCMILLHAPLENERFLEQYDSIRTAFDAMKESFRTHENDTIIRPQQADIITEILGQIDELPLSEVPQINSAGAEIFEHEDVGLMQQENIFTPMANSRPLLIQFDNLTHEQKKVYREVRQQILTQLEESTRSPLRLCVTGEGGTGKSLLIGILRQLITTMCPGGDTSLIMAAPTGVAGRNINGVTLHKAFSLGIETHSVAQYMKLGSRLLENRRRLFRNVLWIIIDEYSMISYEVLRMIHLRLHEIMDNHDPDLLFGGVNILIFGGLIFIRKY